MSIINLQPLVEFYSKKNANVCKYRELNLCFMLVNIYFEDICEHPMTETVHEAVKYRHIVRCSITYRSVTHDFAGCE